MTENAKKILYELKEVSLSITQSAANLANIITEIEIQTEPETDSEFEKYLVVAFANKRYDHIRYRYENLKERELALWQKLKDECCKKES